MTLAFRAASRATNGTTDRILHRMSFSGKMNPIGVDQFSKNPGTWSGRLTRLIQGIICH